MMLMPVMGIPLDEKTYILTPEENSIKIRFPDLTKEYNLIDEAIKEEIPINSLCEIKTTVYYGDGNIFLKSYQNITKEKIKSSYDCNCENIEKEIIDNKTKEKIIKIIEVCDSCYIYENYTVSELIKINPSTFKINKDTEIYEMFEGCSKIKKLENGKWGCSLWSNVNILGTEIKGATWWNVSWDYRQEINTTSFENLTNFQIKLYLNNSNVGNNFNWLNNNSIRFTNSTNNKLYYWIEEWNTLTNKSIIWVNVTQLINNTNTTINMYYGNNAVDSESNGANVFEIFDNFDSGSIDTNIWDILAGSPNIIDGVIEFDGADEGIDSDKIFNGDYMVMGNISMEKIMSANTVWGWSDQSSPGYGSFYYSISKLDFRHYYGDGSWAFTDLAVNDGGFHNLKLSISSIHNKLWYNNILKSSPTSNLPDGDQKIRMYSAGGIAYLKVDWVAVAKYTTITPLIYFGNEEENKVYPTLNWTYQPEINLSVEINPTFLFNMTNVNISSVVFYHSLNDTLTGNFNKSFKYFKDSYILRNNNRGEGDTQSENNAIKYYTGDIGSYGSFRYSLNQRPILQDSGDNWYLFNFTADYHCLLESHIPVDRINLTKELKTNQYLEIWKDNPAIIKLKTFPLEVNRTIHINVNIDDQTATKPLKFYVCNETVNPETVNPTSDNNCGFYGVIYDFDTKDRTLYNSSYINLHFGINENGYVNLNGGIKTSETMYLIMDSEITPVTKSYKLYFANGSYLNDTFLMFEGGAGWTFTNRSETPDLIYSVTGDFDNIVTYVHACNTSDRCINFSLEVESLGARPNEAPTTPLLLTPTTNEKVNETYNITWLDGTDTEGNFFNITILLYWNGVLNFTLKDNNITNGTQYYEWNTTGFNDSHLYEIFIYATDSGGLSSGNSTNGYFEIDNIPTFPIATIPKRLYFYPQRLFYYQ